MQNECHILPCICGIQKNGMGDLIFKAEIETHREKKCLDTNIERSVGWIGRLGLTYIH